MGGGGSHVTVPPPTAEERNLQRQQAEMLQFQRSILEEQTRQQKVLLPFFAEEAGFRVKYNDAGEIIGAEKIEDPLDEQRQRIERALLDRSEKALAGELPVDPALERALAQQEEQLKERLFSQFGSGYDTATPAIQAQEQFRTTAEALRHSARTDQLTLAEQLSLARQGAGMQQQSFNMDMFRTAQGADPMRLAGGAGQTAAGFGAAQEPFIRHRQMELNASVANAQLDAQRSAGFGRLAGSIFGAVFPAIMGSDRRLKVLHERIGRLASGVAVWLFEYRITGERRIGVVAQDVQRVQPDAVIEQDGVLMVAYGEL